MSARGRRRLGRSGELLSLVRDGAGMGAQAPAGAAAPMILRLVVTRRPETVSPSLAAAPRRAHLRAV